MTYIKQNFSYMTNAHTNMHIWPKRSILAHSTKLYRPNILENSSTRFLWPAFQDNYEAVEESTYIRMCRIELSRLIATSQFPQLLDETDIGKTYLFCVAAIFFVLIETSAIHPRGFLQWSWILLLSLGADLQTLDANGFSQCISFFGIFNDICFWMWIL